MNKQGGIGLILAIFFIVMTGFIAVISFSMLSAGITGGMTNILSSRSYGIAYGGMEWYLEQLKDDTNWTDEVGTPTVIALGSGTFNVTINGTPTATSVSFTVTGLVPGYEGQNIQQEMSVTARKFPLLFAIFWGVDSGDLQLSSTTIDGNYWSRGTTTVTGGSRIINGIAYRPDTEEINGGGEYYPPPTGQSVLPDYPVMPQIDTSYYDGDDGLIPTYNNMPAGSGTIDQNTILDLTLVPDHTVRCDTFNTNTTAGSTVAISGYGYIVANNINLNTSSGGGGGTRTLTISPSGGNIVFIAHQSLTVNRISGDNVVTGNPGIIMYSRATGGSDLMTINNNNTNISNALFLGNRAISVTRSANITNSTLYVTNVYSDNYLEVTHNGTVSGSVISMSENASGGLQITNGGSVTGLVYHYGGAQGATYFVVNATITGTVIASRFRNNQISNTTITYNSSVIPNPLPPGFQGFVSREIESWDD